jgi:hypothetical protein
MGRKKRGAPARPIRTKRDYAGASAVVKRMSGQGERDTAAELRLQSLIRELDRFDDDVEDEPDADTPTEYDYSGPRRRWSDDAAGSD